MKFIYKNNYFLRVNLKIDVVFKIFMGHIDMLQYQVLMD